MNGAVTYVLLEYSPTCNHEFPKSKCTLMCEAASFSFIFSFCKGGWVLIINVHNSVLELNSLPIYLSSGFSLGRFFVRAITLLQYIISSLTSLYVFLWKGWPNSMRFFTDLWGWERSREWRWLHCRNVHLLSQTGLCKGCWWGGFDFWIELQQHPNAYWSHGSLLPIGSRPTTNNCATQSLPSSCKMTIFYASAIGVHFFGPCFSCLVLHFPLTVDYEIYV